MTTSNHIYTGAVIALAVQNPILALPLAFASHFVLDALPHYGYDGEGYGEAVKHKLTFVMESVNIIGIPLLVYLLWGQSPWVWLAAVLAISPDFMWIYRYFWFERKGLVPPAGPITRFHKRIQWCERKWGILVEVPFLIIVILTVVRITS
jgi:hypothetical protein